MTDPELVLAVLKQKLSQDQDPGQGQEPDQGQGQESCRTGHRCNVFL